MLNNTRAGEYILSPSSIWGLYSPTSKTPNEWLIGKDFLNLLLRTVNVFDDGDDNKYSSSSDFFLILKLEYNITPITTVKRDIPFSGEKHWLFWKVQNAKCDIPNTKTDWTPFKSPVVVDPTISNKLKKQIAWIKLTNVSIITVKIITLILPFLDAILSIMRIWKFGRFY